MFSRMATAIVRGHTPDGIVIAADGRMSDGVSGEVHLETQRKIFPLLKAQGTFRAAYCMRGNTLLGHRADLRLQGVLFDFNVAIQKAADSLGCGFESLEEFASALGGEVYRRLGEVSRSAAVDFGVTAAGLRQTIATLYLDGYWKGRPARLRVPFTRVGLTLEPPEVFPQPTWDPPCFIGCDAIKHQLWPDGPKAELAMFELIGMAKDYIEACIASTREDCKGIGGHLHIATITPEEGFGWVPGFEPLERLGGLR